MPAVAVALVVCAAVVPLLCWRAPGPAPDQFELLAPDIVPCWCARLGRAHLAGHTGPRFSRESDAGHRVNGAAAAGAGRTGGCPHAQPPRRRPPVVRPPCWHSNQGAALTSRSKPSMRCGLAPRHAVPGRQRWVWDGVVLRGSTPRGQADRPAAPTRQAACCAVASGRQPAHLGRSIAGGDIETGTGANPAGPLPLRSNRRAAGFPPRQQTSSSPRFWTRYNAAGCRRATATALATCPKGVAAATLNISARGGVGPLRCNDLVFRPSDVVS